MSGLGEWDLNPGTAAGDVEEAGAESTAEDTVEDTGPPPLYYGSVDEFVREMIVPIFRRRVGDRSELHWAAEWWRHPEAVIRLEALWRAWEHLRLDPALGMSVWLRDHADYHLAVLFSKDGPFGKAKDTSEPGDPLPYSPPPEGLFDDPRNA